MPAVPVRRLTAISTSRRRQPKATSRVDLAGATLTTPGHLRVRALREHRRVGGVPRQPDRLADPEGRLGAALDEHLDRDTFAGLRLVVGAGALEGRELDACLDAVVETLGRGGAVITATLSLRSTSVPSPSGAPWPTCTRSPPRLEPASVRVGHDFPGDQHGSPRNDATKTVAGSRYSVSGVATCTTSPSCMIPIRSLSMSASRWS